MCFKVCSYHKKLSREGRRITIHNVRHLQTVKTVYLEEIPKYVCSPLEHILLIALAQAASKHITQTNEGYSYIPSKEYEQMRKQLKFKL